jgi:hypothetical protein
VAFIIDEALAGWASHASIVLLHAVQMEAPKVTGTFAASMFPLVSVIDGNVTIRVSASSGKPKAVWIRNGTMEHEIGAGGNFLWNPTGANEFAAMGPVVHHGTRRNQFGLRAINMVRAQLLASLAVEVMDAMTAAVAETRK